MIKIFRLWNKKEVNRLYNLWHKKKVRKKEESEIKQYLKWEDSLKNNCKILRKNKKITVE